MVIRYEQFVNILDGVLNGAITDVATTLTITSATGWPTGGDFRVQIETELVLVTAVSGLTWTIERGVEGTIAVSHSDTTTVSSKLTEGALVQWMRDQDPWATGRPPFKLTDINGITLTKADFTENNFVTNAVADDEDGNITIEQDDHSVINIASLVKAAPSTPYTIIAACTAKPWGDSGAAGPRFGIGFREVATADLLLCEIIPCYINGSRVVHYNSSSSFNSVKSQRTPFAGLGVNWMKMSDDGVDLIMSHSRDGVNWIQFLNPPRTDQFSVGPDQVIFHHQSVDSDPVPLKASSTLVSWSEYDSII
jgi:hypothetical protein